MIIQVNDTYIDTENISIVGSIQRNFAVYKFFIHFKGGCHSALPVYSNDEEDLKKRRQSIVGIWNIGNSAILNF